MPRFPDAVRRAIALASATPGVAAAGTSTPDDWAGVLPFVRVNRGGGSSDHLNDHPTLFVDVFAATYVQAEQVSEMLRQSLCGPPPADPGFDRVTCEAGPSEVPWGDDETVRRFSATYRATTRKRTWA
jgi:hypothetical protein